MAHFALLNEKNIVVNIIVVNNDVMLDDKGNEDEQKGIDFCNTLIEGNWVQTSYNTQAGEHILDGKPNRKNFAGIGYFYDDKKDAFIAPKPYKSWILNENTCAWEAPVNYPNDGKIYVWDEKSTNWKEYVVPQEK